MKEEDKSLLCLRGECLNSSLEGLQVVMKVLLNFFCYWVTGNARRILDGPEECFSLFLIKQVRILNDKLFLCFKKLVDLEVSFSSFLEGGKLNSIQDGEWCLEENEL